MLDLGKRLIKQIKNKFNLAGEVFISQSKGASIEVSEGLCEKFNLFQDHGIGIRILKDKKWGLSYTTDIQVDADTLISSAIHNADYNISDEYNLLATGQSAGISFEELNIYDESIRQLDAKNKLQMMLRLEKEALAADPQINKVLAAVYTDNEFTQTILNTQGVEVHWQETLFSAVLELKAEQDTKVQVGGESQSRRFFGDLDFDKLVDKAVFRTVRMLGAKSVPTQKIPVVLDPYVGCEFLAMLAGGVSADNIQRKKSPLVGKLNTKIAADSIQIIDDGRLRRGLGSGPYDDEGVPTQKTQIVRDGILAAILYDGYTAARDKTVSTGNASRGSFMGSPGVGVNNFYLEQGKVSRAELLKSIKQGLYVMEVMGMHTADPITGDFSVGVSGLWIENGQLTYPVQGVAMADNILKVLQNIELIGNDLKFYGNVGSPTIKIREIMVSGS
ncbi:MAG: TldD/PmbA family protein [bacterium]|nr:TldD/PmbA family protein [bacterium]MDD5756338.1 TldD/PmbA family protein [bacterium]